MKSQIEKLFSGAATAACLSEQYQSFDVLDPQSGVQRQSGEIDTPCVCKPVGEGHFSVTLSSSKAVCFGAVDACLMKSSEQPKCDFILFDEARFYFADIKNVSKSNRKNARSDAYDQLESTIAHFSKIDFSGFDKYAIVALVSGGKYPIFETKSQSKQKEFWDKYRTSLKEGNEVTF